jgi:uncharacterized protein involved in exopolysaccharide biosynthesis
METQGEILAAGPPDIGVSIAALLGKLWRGKWWIVAAMIGGLGSFVGLGFLMTPKYESEVVLAPAQPDRASAALGALGSSFGDLASLVGMNIPTGGANRAVNVAYLTSRQFTERFIVAHDLMPVLFAKRWDAANKRWKSDGSEPPSMEDAFLYFDRGIRKIREDRKTGLLYMRIRWRDREVAARWANQMVSDLNDDIRARAISEAKTSLTFLDAELARTQVTELREAIFRLMESNVKSVLAANVRRDFAFQVVDPATVPDVDKYTSPNWVMLGMVGLLMGMAGGAGFVLLLYRKR